MNCGGVLCLTAERLQPFKLLPFLSCLPEREALTINLMVVNYGEFSHLRNVTYSKIFRNIIY